jgi:hypothetical protein
MGKLKELYTANLEAMEQASECGEVVMGLNDQMIEALANYPLTQNKNVLQ